MIYGRVELNAGAYMTTYIMDDPISMDNNSKAPKKRPFVVICPGGGYEFVSAREGEPIAAAFNAAGINAAVVTYHLKSKFPAALKDLSDAVCVVRENAKTWNVDENKVVVCGFSAGGHLAGSLGVFWNSEPGIKREDKKNKPNGMILAYPVITSGEKAHRGSIESISQGDLALKEHVSLEKNVNSDTPPAFIWHTFEDSCVPVENSLCMAMALREHNIQTEMHIFPKGEHGLSLANDFVAADDNGISEDVAKWIKMATKWVKSL